MRYTEINNNVIKYLLFLTAFTPLIVTWDTIFLYTFGKVVFFRALVEAALILFLIHLSYQFYFRSISANLVQNIKEYFKNPLIILILLFLISYILSTALAVNKYRAFWGDMERGEGLFGMIHYVVFLILTSFIFNKKDWIIFFKISLGISVVLTLYAFLQFIRIKWWPFPFPPTNQPGSFLGNPAFLATHMLFILVFGIIVFSETISYRPNGAGDFSNTKKPQVFWRYFSLSVIALSTLTIFLTGSRGAIVGLAAGVVFILLMFILIRSSSERPITFYGIQLRTFCVVSLLTLAISSGIFLVTKENLFWQKIPGLNRFSEIAIQGVDNLSVSSRLHAWKSSGKAFKERPIFGWGPENYLVTYQKFSDPSDIDYGWFDRAHNKLIDVAVM